MKSLRFRNEVLESDALELFPAYLPTYFHVFNKCIVKKKVHCKRHLNYLIFSVQLFHVQSFDHIPFWLVFSPLSISFYNPIFLDSNI